MVEYGSWAKIVIVEDDVALADIYKTRLEMIGYICFVAHDGLEALTVIERERPSLVLLDIMMPKLAGDKILKVMRETDWGKDVKVLVISNLNEVDAPPGIREQGIEGYAVKANMSNDQIDQLVDNILKPAQQQEDINLDQPPAPDQTPIQPS
jgi:DNA-binding response OmpR family regulator